MSNGRRRNTLAQPNGFRPLPPAARRRPSRFSVVRGARVDEIRRPWATSVALGVAVILLGFVGLGAAEVASASALGRLLTLGGLVQTAHALCVRRRGGLKPPR